MSVENELMHYGVLGMRWGHRKDPSVTTTGRQGLGTVKNLSSKHRSTLENKYQSKGQTKKQAQKSANKQIRAEKFVAGALVAGGAVALTYGLYRAGVAKKDKKIIAEYNHRVHQANKFYNMMKDLPVPEGATRNVSFRVAEPVGLSKYTTEYVKTFVKK